MGCTKGNAFSWNPSKSPQTKGLKMLTSISPEGRSKMINWLENWRSLLWLAMVGFWNVYRHSWHISQCSFKDTKTLNLRPVENLDGRFHGSYLDVQVRNIVWPGLLCHQPLITTCPFLPRLEKTSLSKGPSLSYSTSECSFPQNVWNLIWRSLPSLCTSALWVTTAEVLATRKAENITTWLFQPQL